MGVAEDGVGVVGCQPYHPLSSPAAPVYPEELLKALELEQETVDKLKETPSETVAAKIQEIVGKCL